MISIDLDGTLLNDDGKISIEAYRILQKLSKKGIIIVVSTGRSMVGIPEIIKKSDFIDYYITSNGASCYTKNEKCIIKNWINYNDIKAMENEPIFVIEYLINGQWYVDLNKIESLKKIINDNKIIEYILNTRKNLNNLSDLKNLMIEKININFNEKDYEYAKNKINSFVNEKNNIRTWTDKKHKMDIYNISATKGNSLKILSKKIKILSEEIIAIGNDDNDLEMLKFVGCSIAMKNGNKNIKKIANYVTKYDNNNNGVYEFIKGFFAKK